MNDFLRAIPKNLPRPTANTSTVTLTSPEESVFDKLERAAAKEIKIPKSWKNKPIGEWNKKDLLVYFYARYRDTYHAKLGAIPWQADYATIEDIAVMIEKQLKLDVGVPIMREYFDFCYDSNLINELLSKANRFTLNSLKKERSVLTFAAQRQRAEIESAPPTLEAPQSGVPTEVTTAVLSADEIESAYSIHSQYFIEAFGLLIPVNYLILKKKKTELDAVQYVKKALEKLSLAKNGASKVKKLTELTASFGPYPKWLPFLDIGQFADTKVEVGENSSFEALK